MTIQTFEASCLALSQIDLEAVLEGNENLEGGLESLKENFPFPVSDRPSPFEEKLNFSHVHIMVRVYPAILWTSSKDNLVPTYPR